MADKPAHLVLATDLETLGWRLINLSATIEHRGEDLSMAGRIRETGDDIAHRVVEAVGRWPVVALLG